MSEAFSSETIERLGRQCSEPAWLTQWRTAAWQRHAQLPWPSSSDETWRRTDVSVFDPARPSAIGLEASLVQGVKVSDRQVADLLHPAGDEALVARLDGTWLIPPPGEAPRSGAARLHVEPAVGKTPGGGMRQELPPGVTIMELARAAQERAEVIRPILEADGLTPQEQKLTSLNAAFHHDALLIQIPAGFQHAQPLRLVRLLSVTPEVALFPLTLVVVGEGSRVSLVEEDVGLAVDSPDAAHTINGRIELILEPHSTVRYCRIQRWAAGAHEFLLQRATLREGAQLDMVNVNIGGRVSKTHVIAQLLGAQAMSRVYGFVFGHGRQHVDFHSLQDHQAPRTMSDLLYKAALTDASRMIYTGLIRIANAAKQTDAYQANHNLLLSQQAKAETIPMLEILADDVRCKHGATIGPVDEEQLFYLMSRGIPRTLAERILVRGFVEPIIRQVPGEVLQERLLEELEGSLLPTPS